jgi:hypothetical protein
VWILLHRGRVTGDGSADRRLTAEDLARQRALRAAVLIDASGCLLGVAGRRDARSRRDAVRWILSRDTRSPFSFHNVCDSLGFEPSRIRRFLLAPALGVDVDDRLALVVGDATHPVRRPRRDRARYVVLQGGRRA